MDHPKPISRRTRKVLLIPDCGLYLGFRLPPMFCKAGFAVDALCLEGNPVGHSRYIDHLEVLENEDELFHRTVELILHDPPLYDAFIVIREPLVRRLVATQDPDLLERWQKSALSPGPRDFYLSKLGLETARLGWGLAIPPGKICRTTEDIYELGREVGWPLIAKPSDLSGGSGVTKIAGEDEASGYQIPGGGPVLVQKFIKGPRGLVDMMCSGGKPLAWLASHSTKQVNGPFTPSTARRFSSTPELTPLVEAVAANTGFEGFCGFDFIHEEGTGKHWLIEFHPRPPSGFRFGPACGVDFSKAIARWLEGTAGTMAPLVQPPGPAINAHYFTGDLTRCIRQRDWRGLLAWLPRPHYRHDVFWDDLPLLLGMFDTKRIPAVRQGRRKFRKIVENASLFSTSYVVAECIPTLTRMFVSGA